MPITKHMEHRVGRKSTEHQSATALRKRESKASGTRVGTLQDWRQGSMSEKAQRRYGQILRDGR